MCIGPTNRQAAVRGFGQPAKIVVTRDAKGQELTAKHYDNMGNTTNDGSYESC